MVELLLIADDMTGALDSGVKLAHAGVRTVATADLDCAFDLAGVQALVASTQSRHLPPGEAYERVFRLAQAARQAGVKLL